MRVHVSKSAVLVKRILLEIEPASVDVRAENFQAVFQRFSADLKQRDGFFHAHAINFVARMKFFAGLNHVVKIFVADSFRTFDSLNDGFAFGLATAYEVDITRRKLFECRFVLVGVFAPHGKFFVLVFSHFTILPFELNSFPLAHLRPQLCDLRDKFVVVHLIPLEISIRQAKPSKSR